MCVCVCVLGRLTYEHKFYIANTNLCEYDSHSPTVYCLMQTEALAACLDVVVSLQRFIRSFLTFPSSFSFINYYFPSSWRPFKRHTRNK